MSDANKNLKQILDEEMHFIEPGEEGLQTLRDRLDNAKTTQKTAVSRWNPSRIAATAAGVLLAILIPAASVTAYEYYQSTYRLPRMEQNIAAENMTLENEVTVVDEAVGLSMENLQIEWLGQELTGDGAVMKFRLKTKDGSPLITDDPNKAPVFVPLAFENVQLTVGDVTKQFKGIYEPYELLPQDYYIGCTAIADNYSYADFELSVQDSMLSLQGQEMDILLENIAGTYHTFADLQTNGTLADILAGTGEGEDLHIVFSEEYPDCYIDSYGFVSDSIYENPENLLHIYPKGKNMFTMTVVCDEASKDAIRNMTFQNTDTGLNGSAELDVKELEDGRLRFYYSVNYDGSYMTETYPTKGGTPRDTTMEDLQHLVLKMYSGRVTETIMTGTLEEKIILE